MNIQDMIGQKQYEITDHLGNVLSTVSDQHLGRDVNGDSVIDYYNAVIPAAYDYYPFGMLMPFRYTQDNSTHCATITTDKLYPVWVHHNIILNNGTSPIANSYGSGVATVLTGGTGINIYSPMITSGASISVPLQQKLAYNMDLNIQSISGSYSAQVLDSDSTVLGAITIAESGNYSLSYSAPTASPVTLVFKAQSTGSNISLPAAGYWVFTHQSQMVTMTICDQNDNYRFGFNGQMKDNEWAGLGNSLDYSKRMMDNRIARFRTVDPITKSFSSLTPYVYSENSPIAMTDKNGNHAEIVITKGENNSQNEITKVDVNVVYLTSAKEAIKLCGDYTFFVKARADINSTYNRKDFQIANNNRSYKISFNITIKDPIKNEAEFKQNVKNNPIANFNTFNYENIKGIKLPTETLGGNWININLGQKASLPYQYSHEASHTLGEEGDADNGNNYMSSYSSGRNVQDNEVGEFALPAIKLANEFPDKKVIIHFFSGTNEKGEINSQGNYNTYKVFNPQTGNYLKSVSVPQTNINQNAK